MAKPQHKSNPPRPATAKQMRLWRNLSEEAGYPAPPSSATLIEAMRNIDLLLQVKRRT